MNKTIQIIAALLLLSSLSYSQTNVAASSNGATATASSTYPNYDAMEAIDGLIPSPFGWLSADKTMPEWLEVTFDSTYSIDSIVINFHPYNHSQTYDLEYWDGSSWKLIAAVSPSLDTNVTIKFPYVQTNKVRYYCTVGNNNGYAFVEEILVFEGETTTGTENLQTLEEITLFPNPSSGQVNLNLGNITDASVKVYTQDGKMVYKKEGMSGNQQFELEGAAGLYFIEVTSEDKTQKFKLIKE